jgi:hypothetical protein
MGVRRRRGWLVARRWGWVADYWVVLCWGNSLVEVIMGVIMEVGILVGWEDMVKGGIIKRVMGLRDMAIQGMLTKVMGEMEVMEVVMAVVVMVVVMAVVAAAMVVEIMATMVETLVVMMVVVISVEIRLVL